jgi:hypothetical protein
MRRLMRECLGDWKRPRRDTAHGKKYRPSKNGETGNPQANDVRINLAGRTR